MHDYAQGAFEALSWVHRLFDQANNPCEECKRIQEKIEEMLAEIERGAAKNFTFKLKRMS